MKSIVTGGAGFIGSHIVDKLLNLNHEVIVIDNESSEVHEKFYHNDKAKYFKYDIADYDFIRPIFRDVDYVFHLAAESRIQPTLINPLLCFRTNAYGTGVILQCARESGVRRVMYSSTSSAYGLKNEAPYSENMIEDCLNPYSVAKVSGEKMCKMYTDLFNLETIVFRYFNVYGPREPIKGQYAPVVGLFMRQYLANEPFTIVGDGTQRRDFTHVADAVSANILAMRADRADVGKYFGTVFNIGTGTNTSVCELADMISTDHPKVFLPPRPGEAYITKADNTKSQVILGWQPTQKIEEYMNAFVEKTHG